MMTMRRFSFIVLLSLTLLFIGAKMQVFLDQIKVPSGTGLIGFDLGSASTVTVDSTLTLSGGLLRVTTPASSPATFTVNEIPTTTTPGVTYTLLNTPIVGSVEIYRNGLHQSPGVGADYTVSGAAITFSPAIDPTSVITANYRR